MIKQPDIYAFIHLLNSDDIHDVAYEIEIMPGYEKEDCACISVNSFMPYEYHYFYMKHHVLRYLCLKLANAYGFSITNTKEVMEHYNKQKFQK